MDEKALVEAIYQVAAGGAWAPLLPHLAAFVGAPSGALELTDAATGEDLRVFAQHELDAHFNLAILDAIAAGEGRDDASPAMARALGGDVTRVVTLRQAMTPEERSRSWFWNENLARAGQTDLAGLVLDVAPGSRPVVLSLISRDADGFTPGHVSRYQRLSEHLRRAARAQRRSRALWSSSPTLAGALENSPTACLLLGEGERLLFANAAAEALLRRPVFKQGARRIAARDPAQERALQALIRQVVGVGLGEVRVGGELILQDASGWVLVTAVPVGPENPFLAGFGGVRAAMYLRPEGAPHAAAIVRLARAYDLTAAEAEILGPLLAGLTPSEIAERRNRSLATVRTQVASLLEKAGVSRVEALVSLAHRLGPA